MLLRAEPQRVYEKFITSKVTIIVNNMILNKIKETRNDLLFRAHELTKYAVVSVKI